MGIDIAFALYPTACTVKDVRLCNFEEAMFHQLFLDDVLHILDIDERLPGTDCPSAHFIRNLHSRCRIKVQGKEGFTDRHFDFGRIPWHHLTASTDQANLGTVHGHMVGKLPIAGGPVVGTGEHQALGHIVSIIFNQCFFDEFVKVVEGEAGGAAFLLLLQPLD